MDLRTIDFETLRKNTEEYYKSVDKVYSPALRANVFFNSDGFHHLRFDKTRTERIKKVQRNKLSFLKSAVEIIKTATTVQEYRRSTEPVGKLRADGFRKTALVEYWAFVAILNTDKNIRVKTIVRKVGEGQHHFWSVMPYWVVVDITKQQTVRRTADESIEDE